MQIIESFQNEKIKKISRWLTKNNDRKKAGVFLVEGQQENERAQEFGYEATEFYIAPDIFVGKSPSENVNFVSKAVYEKIAYRGTTEGIIGVYKHREEDLQSLELKNNSTIIILESIEKPGNLGAILRSCEAFGIDALIVTDPKVDFYNPNVIRSSVGCLFGMRFFAVQNEEALNFLTKNNFEIYTTFMSNDAKQLASRDMNVKSAVLFGTEHSGLSDFWKGKGKNTLIPMVGSIDSLNLSNAVAITCYEALRQKMK
ncbi:TrmH family RNA methyltransferase [Soonwooa sp.]|uniref:TrmH family RNA methyltransferase n=1 Tax=Soonwooa sp. TaxID=1938592 RepID=UPI002602FE13|nr:TrmH family RNA methyltransferase [Soonwooa sp.]